MCGGGGGGGGGQSREVGQEGRGAYILMHPTKYFISMFHVVMLFVSGRECQQHDKVLCGYQEKKSKNC